MTQTDPPDHKKPGPLRVARLAQGLSLREFAKTLGVNQEALRKIENRGLVRDHRMAIALYSYFQEVGYPITLLDIYCPDNKEILEDVAHEAERAVRSG